MVIFSYNIDGNKFLQHAYECFLINSKKLLCSICIILNQERAVMQNIARLVSRTRVIFFAKFSSCAELME